MADNITLDERFILSVCKLNKRLPRKEWRRAWHFGRLTVAVLWRSRTNLLGRFGGGWNWKLGIQIGGRTALVSLLVCEARLTWEPPDGK